MAVPQSQGRCSRRSRIPASAGKGGPAIIGYGKVSGKAENDAGTWRVPVEFESILDPSVEVLANRDDLRGFGEGKQFWKTQSSGVLLPENVAHDLERLVVGKPPKAQSENLHSNPDWTRDELILALDLYFRMDSGKVSKNDPELLAVSDLLNRLPIHSDRGDAATFRNPNGVYMKLGNFRHIDPDYAGEGLKAGSHEDEKVWTEFANDRARLRQAAEAIKSSARSGPVHRSELSSGDRTRNIADIPAIVGELNSRARTHAIGDLQEIRAALKGLTRQPGSDIFSSQTTKEHWAFHHGGRQELQFNVGVEAESGYRELRFGVAFSFEASRTLPAPVETLAGKVRLFNDFMQLNAELFGDLRMWHFENDKRSPDYMPGPIPWERVKTQEYIKFG